mgnify:CR=1 FL=1
MNKKMPTIALVDDDRNILTSVGMTLEAEGYSVQKYNDGAAALQSTTGALLSDQGQPGDVGRAGPGQGVGEDGAVLLVAGEVVGPAGPAVQPGHRQGALPGPGQQLLGGDPAQASSVHGVDPGPDLLHDEIGHGDVSSGHLVAGQDGVELGACGGGGSCAGRHDLGRLAVNGCGGCVGVGPSAVGAGALGAGVLGGAVPAGPGAAAAGGWRADAHSDAVGVGVG